MMIRTKLNDICKRIFSELFSMCACVDVVRRRTKSVKPQSLRSAWSEDT